MSKEKYSNFRDRRKPSLVSYLSEESSAIAGKLDLLNRLIGKSHQPSIGRYKEKLLTNYINSKCPKKYAVGTGFVIFPCDYDDSSNSLDVVELMNLNSHTVSKQMDIIIYDQNDFSPIYQDDDFVLVKPESVKMIIEVKASLSSTNLKKAIDGLNDFSSKWSICHEFYKSRHVNVNLTAPKLIIFSWEKYKAKNNSRGLKESTIRKTLVKNYQEIIDLKLHTSLNFPIISRVDIYNLTSTYFTIHSDESGITGGYTTDRGFVIKNENGSKVAGGDKTLLDINSDIQLLSENEFNHIFAYPDQSVTVGDHFPGADYSPFLTKKEVEQFIKN